MAKRLWFAAAAAFSLYLTGAANAATLIPTGGISINGSASVVTGSSITFDNPANAGAGTGGFSSLAACLSCVTMVGTLDAAALPTIVYTINESGGVTADLDLQTATFTALAGGGLEIDGTGLESLTGFLDTPVSFSLTAQGGSGSFSFSASTLATPLPSTWAMFISSLLGLGFFAYRGSKSRKTPVSMLGALPA